MERLVAFHHFIKNVNAHAQSSDDFFDAHLIDILAQCLGRSDIAITTYQNSQYVQSITAPHIRPMASFYDNNCFYKKDSVAQYITRNIQMLASSGACIPVRGSDILGRTADNGKTYQDLLGQGSFGYVAVMPINFRYRIAVYKGKDEQDFADEELELFSMLMDVIRTAYSSYAYKRFSENSFSMVGQLLDRHQIGYIIWNDSSEMIRLNSSAACYLSDMTCGTHISLAPAILLSALDNKSTCVCKGYRLNLYERITERTYGNHVRSFCVIIMKTNKGRYSGDAIQNLSFDSLSSRELEILELFAKGESYAQISGSLFISESTVKTHLKNIYRKLGIDSQRKLIYEYLTYIARNQ